MANEIVIAEHLKMGTYAGLNAEQMTRFYALIENAVPCNRKDVMPEVYSRQVAQSAVRVARSPERADATDRMLLGLSEPKKAAKTTAAQKNPCTRCGGVGSGNWGSVRNGVCYRCGGSGVNPGKAHDSM